MSKQYDFLIIGAGLYGSVFAYKAKQAGKKVLIIDKRSHFGGNLYCENIEGINVHKYGAHIFHTSEKEVWDFVNLFTEFNRYTNSPIANYKGKIYNLPFNMNTFYQLWGVKTPDEAKTIIENQRTEFGITSPKNLEEQAISLVGNDIYEILIKGYTEKQWGRKASELPAFIIKRLPVRFTFNNNYFDDKYQGIPIGGYNNLFESLLNGIELKCNTDFFEDRDFFESLADKIVYTGKIDEFYNYRLGKLEYRSLRFESEILDMPN
jgi:UDP-galactopyranose mutase